ncbi:MAG: DUF2250 domain-containing protein [Thermoproteus sp.]
MNILRKKLYVDILLHLKRAGIDYGKSIARGVGAPLASVLAALDELERAGLIERAGGHVLKRSKARMKLSPEVRKHHVYFKLSRSGEAIVRCLKRRGAAAYLDALSAEERRALAELCRGERRGAPPSLIEAGLADPSGILTPLGVLVAALVDPACKKK